MSLNAVVKAVYKADMTDPDEWLQHATTDQEYSPGTEHGTRQRSSQKGKYVLELTVCRQGKPQPRTNVLTRKLDFVRVPSGYRVPRHCEGPDNDKSH